MKDSRRNGIICIVLITTVLAIFIGPGLIKPTNEEVIKAFVHAYFETNPESYRILYPGNKFGKNLEKEYIKDQFDELATNKAMESILEQENFVSHIRRAHIKKADLTVKTVKITIVRHDTWNDIYKIDGYVESVRNEDGSSEQLRFLGQLGLRDIEGSPKIESIMMMIDDVRYYSKYRN